VGLVQIARTLIGKSDCESLYKQTSSNYEISGAKFGFGDFSIGIGQFSKTVNDHLLVTETMALIDSNQYLLCKRISAIKDAAVKDKLNQIHLQLIAAANQFIMLAKLINDNPNQNLQKEFANWVKFSNKLNKACILSMGPAKQMFDENIESELKEIMTFQQITDEEMNSAIQILR